MLSIIQNIPNVKKHALHYVFEDLKIQDQPNNGIWIEFGVYNGHSITYISNFTKNIVYGFDSFEGLPETWRSGFEKGRFDRQGVLPEVPSNVTLIKGWFSDTLTPFLETQKNKKISFMHIDCDLYSSTKHILNITRPFLDKECVIVFDELVNYPGFDGETGELKAIYEYILENNLKENIDYEWIGMDGTIGEGGEQVALKLKIH